MNSRKYLSFENRILIVHLRKEIGKLAKDEVDQFGFREIYIRNLQRSLLIIF